MRVLLGGVGALYSVTVSTSLVSNVLSLEHSGWLHPFLLGNWLGLCNLLLGMITQYCSPFHLEYHLSTFLTLLLLLNLASSGLWEPDWLCHLLFKTLPSSGVQGPGLCMMGYALGASVPSAVCPIPSRKAWLIFWQFSLLLTFTSFSLPHMCQTECLPCFVLLSSVFYPRLFFFLSPYK